MKAKALRKANSKAIASFIHDWVCRFGVPGRIVTDGGGENKKLASELIDRFNITNVPIAAYHPQSNGLVERGHKPIVDALAKLGGKWTQHLSSVLWADRVTTRRSTGYSPFQLVYGQECILPVEFDAKTWTTLDWSRKGPISTAELLALRARQLERREEDLVKVAESIKQSRLQNKDYFDRHMRKRNRPIVAGDLVLLYNSQLDKQWSKKLDNRWLGPYRVKEVREDRGTYRLEELDGAELSQFVPGEWLKLFVVRGD